MQGVASHSARGTSTRWRIWVSLAVLATGGLIVLAMAYLEHSQARTLARSVAQVREFREARLDLNASVLRLGWATANHDARQVLAERAAIPALLLGLEASLNRFEEDPEAQELAGTARSLLVAFRFRLPRNETEGLARPADLLDTYMAFEAALSRLDGHSAAAVQALVARRQ